MHDKTNIVLLTVDSLAANHLGCYGYKRETSPFLDSLANENVLAERFYTPAVPTHPSYTTLLTGQYPISHNIVSQGGRAEISRDAPSLPELFLQAGYVTCAVDNLWRQRYWFGRGFEYIIDPSTRGNRLHTIECDELNQRAIPWLQSHADDPFFLYMHYWDPHWPYLAREKYRHLFYSGNPTDPNNHSLDRWWDDYMGTVARDTWLKTPQGPITDANYVTALYDQQIRRLDDGMRDIITAIDHLGIAGQTLIVFLADHGESMTEHDVFYDHTGLHDTVLHVPLIVRLPGRVQSGVRLPQMLQHVDVAPTLLEAAGLPIPDSLEGRSFWKLATGEEQAGGYDAIISMECSWRACWSIRTDRYKYFLGREPDEDGNILRELYDLESDPGEERNIVAADPETAAALEAQLEAWIAKRMRIAGRDEDPLREQGSSFRQMLLQAN